MKYSDLRESGLSWQRLESFGLEYKYGALFLQDKLERAEAITKLETEIKRYARRQMTWWKRNTEIQWMEKENTFKQMRL